MEGNQRRDFADIVALANFLFHVRKGWGDRFEGKPQEKTQVDDWVLLIMYL